MSEGWKEEGMLPTPHMVHCGVPTGIIEAGKVTEEDAVCGTRMTPALSAYIT